MQDLYDIICDFITREWVGTSEDSARAFASNHDIDGKTLRRIKSWETASYKVALYTLEKICASRNITLQEFFGLIKNRGVHLFPQCSSHKNNFRQVTENKFSI